MGMRKCPECSNLVEENLKECKYCGYPFDGTEELVEEVENTEDFEVLEENEKVQNTVEEQGENLKADEAESTQLEESFVANDSRNESVPEEEAIAHIEDVLEEHDDKKEAIPEEAQIHQIEETPELENKKHKINFNKRLICEIAGGAILVVSVVSAFNFNNKYHEYKNKYTEVSKKLEDVNHRHDELQQKNKNTENENTSLNSTISELNAQIEELENGAAKQLADIKNAYEAGQWQQVIDLAAQLHAKYNGTPEDQEAQSMAQSSQNQLNQIAAQKAAEEAKGYETGITYDQLARTPDQFKGKKVKFTGKVIQVLEQDNLVQIRLAVDDNYDTVLLGLYESSIVSSRVLEEDYITIYGISSGTISYESTSGKTITIPGVAIEKIDQ